MNEVNFLQSLHTNTKRDYLARVNAEKPACMRIAKQFGADYWDGDRKFGYGGMIYDGRWKPLAQEIIKHYELQTTDEILDIGCGKGFLLHEFIPYTKSQEGIDISEYAIQNGKIRNIELGDCTKLPYDDYNFDFVCSINVFHNLGYKHLKTAIKELVRVGKEKMYICVESHRNEEELCNLQAWQLTCLSYYSPDDWLQIYDDCGYKGDYEFIYFE